jgi:3-hydroxyacyl-CoA dehydrogenase
MRSMGVIGAGQMGAGIAQVSALAGYDVILSDVDLARAEKGKEGIAGQLGKLVQKGRLDAQAAEAASRPTHRPFRSRGWRRHRPIRSGSSACISSTRYP